VLWATGLRTTLIHHPVRDKLRRTLRRFYGRRPTAVCLLALMFYWLVARAALSTAPPPGGHAAAIAYDNGWLAITALFCAMPYFCQLEEDRRKRFWTCFAE